jgi:hypothetical protein
LREPEDETPISPRRRQPPGPGDQSRRRTRRGALAVFLLAAALPAVLWHRTVGAIAADFRMDADYLVTGWSPWVLMVLGLLCFVPVALHEWRDPDRRFPVRGTGAWSGWGVTLYLLGFLLATQVSQIAASL